MILGWLCGSVTVRQRSTQQTLGTSKGMRCDGGRARQLVMAYALLQSAPCCSCSAYDLGPNQKE